MGAPRANLNALKHGLYARHFTDMERNGLRRMSPEDFELELATLRVIAGRIFDRMNAEPSPINEEMSKLANSFCKVVSRIVSLARLNGMLNGSFSQLEEDLKIVVEKFTPQGEP